MPPAGFEPTAQTNEWPQTVRPLGSAGPSHSVPEMRKVEPTSLGSLNSEIDVACMGAENNSFLKGLR
jgi:hypothetical protein